MQWVEGVLAAVGVFREVSLGLSCPYHCGPSGFPAFGSGLALGLIVGFALSLLLFLFILSRLDFAAPLPQRPGFLPAVLEGQIRQRRVAGYLHD